MSGTIRIHGVDIPVDVRAELEEYDWSSANWTDRRRFRASSPFRYDRTPSFFVDTDEESPYYGCWSDSAASDPEWASGNFTKILAFLRDETYEEAAEYLTLKYGPRDDAEVVRLYPKKLCQESEEYGRKTVSIAEYYNEPCAYIHKRMISEPVAQMMRIGYDSKRKAAVIPWMNADGSVGNVKFRRTGTKVFWYQRGGRPIREMVYGIDVIYRRCIRKAAIVEAEIDALTLMSCGIPAIATGGTAFTEDKRRLIVQSPLEEIVIIRDNDGAGRNWRNAIYLALRGDLRVSAAVIPGSAKDANEYAQACGLVRLGEVVRRTRRLSSLARSRLLSAGD